KALTTLKLTSASSRARRISRIAASTSPSLSLPRERTSESVACSRSESWSNTGSAYGELALTRLSGGQVQTRRWLLGEQGAGEVLGIEWAQVLERLAGADQL